MSPGQIRMLAGLRCPPWLPGGGRAPINDSGDHLVFTPEIWSSETVTTKCEGGVGEAKHVIFVGTTSLPPSLSLSLSLSPSLSLCLSVSLPFTPPCGPRWGAAPFLQPRDSGGTSAKCTPCAGTHAATSGGHHSPQGLVGDTRPAWAPPVQVGQWSCAPNIISMWQVAAASRH